MAAAVSHVLSTKGFTAGNVGNNEGEKVTTSQVQAAAVDDLGAQAVAADLGGLPVVEDQTVPPGSVRVVLADDYTGPGSGLDGSDVTLMGGDSMETGVVTDTGELAPAPPQIITAGTNDPKCVN